MTFGTSWGWDSDRGDSRQIYDAFVEAGGNFIDTAKFYRLDAVSRIELGFPHDFLKSEMASRAVFGETGSLIDNHR